MESNEHVLCKYQAVYCQPPGQFGTAPRSRGSPIDAAAAVCSQLPPLAINLASAAEGGGGFNSDKSQAQFFFIRVICCPHCVKWEQKQSRGWLSATIAPLAAGFRVLNNFWSVGNNLKLFQWNIIILITDLPIRLRMTAHRYLLLENNSLLFLAESWERRWLIFFTSSLTLHFIFSIGEKRYSWNLRSINTYNVTFLFVGIFFQQTAFIINFRRCLNVTRKADWTFLNNLATFVGFLFSYFHRFTIGSPSTSHHFRTIY